MLSIQRWLNLALDLLVATLAVMVISLAVGLRGSTTGGQIGIALNVVLGFNSVLLRLVETWTGLETSLGAVARLKTFESDTISEDRPGEILEPPQNWPEYGGIEFRNVSAYYGYENFPCFIPYLLTLNSLTYEIHRPNVPALDNITLSLPPGTKLGICGRTGSGKSSLLLTLLRLLDLDRGSIHIDGLDLANLPREAVRKSIIAIPQDPFFLPSSVRINLDPSHLLRDETLVSALEKVGLWTVIEERGKLDAMVNSLGLSQGQQQLFCLARAMLRDSKVVVLDEATSSVDLETEKKIQSVIKDVFRDRTVITVAHRLESIVESDVVAVLDGGRLVEVGEPAVLMDSVFRRVRDRVEPRYIF